MVGVRVRRPAALRKALRARSVGRLIHEGLCDRYLRESVAVPRRIAPGDRHADETGGGRFEPIDEGTDFGIALQRLVVVELGDFRPAEVVRRDFDIAGTDTLGLRGARLQSHGTNLGNGAQIQFVAVRRCIGTRGIGHVAVGSVRSVPVGTRLAVDHQRTVVRIGKMGGFALPSVTVDRQIVLPSRRGEVQQVNALLGSDLEIIGGQTNGHGARFVADFGRIDMDRRPHLRFALGDRQGSGLERNDPFGSQPERGAVRRIVGIECRLGAVERDGSVGFERTRQFEGQRLVPGIRGIIDIGILPGNVKERGRLVDLHGDLLQVRMDQQDVSLRADVAVGEQFHRYHKVFRVFDPDQLHRIEDHLESTGTLVPGQGNPLRFDPISALGQCLVRRGVFRVVGFERRLGAPDGNGEAFGIISASENPERNGGVLVDYVKRGGFQHTLRKEAGRSARQSVVAVVFAGRNRERQSRHCKDDMIAFHNRVFYHW